MVVLNAAFIGLDTHLSIDRALNHQEKGHMLEAFTYVHICFAACFLLELLVRIVAFKSVFLQGPDYKWNLFDTGLVISSIIEEMLENMAPVGFLRVFRGIRMIRVLRLVRVFRLFRDLRLMV